MAGRQHVRAAALLCLGLLGLAPLALAYSGEATAYSGESRFAIAASCSCLTTARCLSGSGTALHTPCVTALTFDLHRGSIKCCTA